MTISSPDIIADLLTKQDTCPHSPTLWIIYRYTHINGSTLYAVFMLVEHDDLTTSPFVRDYEVLWSLEDGLTDVGFQFLEQHRPLPHH